MSPWGLIIGGEELHNNHHIPDVGQVLDQVVRDRYGLVVHPRDAVRGPGQGQEDPAQGASGGCPPGGPQHAGSDHRQPLRRYGALRQGREERVQRGTGEAEGRPRGRATATSSLPASGSIARKASWPRRSASNWPASSSRTRALHTFVEMRRELAAIWGRSSLTREQLLQQLQAWCHRAEASGIQALQEFSLRLRRYA